MVQPDARFGNSPAVHRVLSCASTKAVAALERARLTKAKAESLNFAKYEYAWDQSAARLEAELRGFAVPEDLWRTSTSVLTQDDWPIFDDKGKTITPFKGMNLLFIGVAADHPPDTDPDSRFLAFAPPIELLTHRGERILVRALEVWGVKVFSHNGRIMGLRRCPRGGVAHLGATWEEGISQHEITGMSRVLSYLTQVRRVDNRGGRPKDTGRYTRRGFLDEYPKRYARLKADLPRPPTQQQVYEEMGLSQSTWYEKKQEWGFPFPPLTE
jgi:hypothetical protein